MRAYWQTELPVGDWVMATRVGTITPSSLKRNFRGDPLVSPWIRERVVVRFALAVTADTENSHWNFDGIKCSTFVSPSTAIRQHHQTLGDLETERRLAINRRRDALPFRHDTRIRIRGKSVLTLSKLQNLSDNVGRPDSLEATLDRDAYLPLTPRPHSLALYRKSLYAESSPRVAIDQHCRATGTTSRTPGTPALDCSRAWLHRR